MIDWGSGYTEVEDPEPKNKPSDNNWPIMHPCAYYGLAGEVVATLAPHTESDPNALLLQYHVSFGSCVGRKPYYLAEDTKHFPNLFEVLVGVTAKSRKGTAGARIRRIFDLVDNEWSRERIVGGMSSGEGVISAVRDPTFTTNKKTGVEEVVDFGVADKRLLLEETEFFQPLAVLKREGNILSRVVRDAWDCRPVLATLTKNSPTRATEPFISVIGHITEHELRQALDHTSMANGFANRFLFACVRRSKILPHGGTLDPDVIGRLAAKTQEAITCARRLRRVPWAKDAARMWEEIYPGLSEGKPGLLGAIVARAEAQTVRLALVYALQDCSPKIERVHLEAALAVWKYSEASAQYVFGDLLGDPVADTILRELRHAGAVGRSRTEIFNLFNRNFSGARIDQALVCLLNFGKARREMQPSGGGRPREMWFAT